MHESVSYLWSDLILLQMKTQNRSEHNSTFCTSLQYVVILTALSVKLMLGQCFNGTIIIFCHIKMKHLVPVFWHNWTSTETNQAT